MSSNLNDVNAQQKNIKLLVGQLREKEMKLTEL